MIGDDGGIEDGAEGLAFLDRFLLQKRREGNNNNNNNNNKKHYYYSAHHAIDAGAGVGRITKHILLKRYDSVQLIEADPGWSMHSRHYLGRKRSNKCTFTCARLEELDCTLEASSRAADLVWLQWTLQYMTDRDAVRILQTLAARLVNGTGFLIVKENRPYGGTRMDRFQMETPDCSGRYDITRTNDHHRFLFQRAGLVVDRVEENVETNTWALVVGTDE
jgi:SAM-dependent methyltransferase